MNVFKILPTAGLNSTCLGFLAGLLFLTKAHGASCDPVRTFADGKQPNRTIFVSSTGSSSTANGSRENPYESLDRALRGVQPGDAIRLLPGTYPAGTSIRGLVGTAENPIWIGGLPGEARPTIHGGSVGIQLSKVRYLVIENLTVSGATGNGINCDDGADYANPEAASHLIFRNIAFQEIGRGGNQDGLKLSGVNSFFVLDCEFRKISAGGSGIDHVGCHRGLVARSTFTETGNAVQCKGGSEDIEIRWNRFINGTGRAVNVGGSTGHQFFRPPLSRTGTNWEARNIRVLANIFRGYESPVAFVGAVHSLAANNTIVEPRRWVVRILQEMVTGNGYTFQACGNNRFINNLIHYDRSSIGTHVNIGGNTDALSFEFSNNLWYASNQPNQSRPGLPVSETAGIYGSDPRFKDLANNDFSIPANSAAAGKGAKINESKADFGERCFANPPAIGAFEANP